MTLAKKASMLVLAGATALALGAPEAQARDRGNGAALAGGLLFGIIAGAAIAGAAQAHDGDRVYYSDPDEDVVYVRPRHRVVRQYIYHAPPPVYYDEEETIYVPRRHQRVYLGY